MKELNKGPLSQPRFIRDGLMPLVNPVRNSSGALNLAGIILKSNPAAAAGPEALGPEGTLGHYF